MHCWQVTALRHDMPWGYFEISCSLGSWGAVALHGSGEGFDYRCHIITLGDYVSVAGAMATCERYASAYVFVAFLARMGAGVRESDERVAAELDEIYGSMRERDP